MGSQLLKTGKTTRLLSLLRGIKITNKEPHQSYKPNRLRSFLGGIICLSLSLMGFWIAFYGEGIEGGIPFIAEATNQMIGRIMFGGGAVITGVLAIVAFRELFGKRSK